MRRMLLEGVLRRGFRVGTQKAETDLSESMIPRAALGSVSHDLSHAKSNFGSNSRSDSGLGGGGHTYYRQNQEESAKIR